jgi:hypothetical protein
MKKLLLLVILCLSSCVSKSREEELLNVISALEIEIDECKNGEERILARIDYTNKIEMYDSVRFYVVALKSKHPESSRIDEMDKLIKTISVIEEKARQFRIEKEKEAERLANISNTGMWEISFYSDDFGKATKEKLIKNEYYIKGTFSNTATQDSDLHVRFLIDSYKEIDIMLYEYAGNNPVKAYGSERYKIRMLQNGQVTDMIGTNYGTRISVEESGAIKIHNAFKKETALSFFIYEVDRPTTVYKFEVYRPQYYPNAYRILTTGK